MSIEILLRKRSLGKTQSKGHATRHKTTTVHEIRRQIVLGKFFLNLALQQSPLQYIFHAGPSGCAQRQAGDHVGPLGAPLRKIQMEETIRCIGQN